MTEAIGLMLQAVSPYPQTGSSIPGALCFDRLVPNDGYSWWYLDALSDDGHNGITIIIFIGSVFSPYYAWARRRSSADPLQHCAVNVSLYSKGRKRWAMTERGRDHVFRQQDSLVIGSSAVTWDGERLIVDIDEITAPWPTRLRGRVSLHPAAVIDHRVALDGAGLHNWQPIAPCARVEVALSQPGLKWSGAGYLDSNHGSAPLEKSFASWDWSRGQTPVGDSMVLYDIERRDETPLVLAQRFDNKGRIENFAAPPKVSLPVSAWRVARSTRTDGGSVASIAHSLEDGPFYVRSVFASQLLGASVRGVHESLSLDRFRSPWVQMLLPFRMPRRA